MVIWFWSRLFHCHIPGYIVIFNSCPISLFLLLSKSVQPIVHFIVPHMSRLFTFGSSSLPDGYVSLRYVNIGRVINFNSQKLETIYQLAFIPMYLMYNYRNIFKFYVLAIYDIVIIWQHVTYHTDFWSRSSISGVLRYYSAQVMPAATRLHSNIIYHFYKTRLVFRNA